MQYVTKTHKIQTHKHKWIYAQWNGRSVTKPNPENCKNCSSKCAYDCAELQYMYGCLCAFIFLHLIEYVCYLMFTESVYSVFCILCAAFWRNKRWWWWWW